MQAFKQFDPVADTETANSCSGVPKYKAFKQFDPVADTETFLVH